MSAWKAGVASRPITPPAGLEMSGFAAREGVSTGILDDLWVRALSFSCGGDRTVIAALDLLGVDSAIVDAIRRKVAQIGKIDTGRIVVSATHTHAGPAVLRNALLGQADEKYLARLVDASAGAIAEAIQGETDVALSVGSATCASVGSNRRDSKGPVDRRVYVLRVDARGDERGDASGKTIALLVNYACHAVAMGPQNTHFSSDYVHFTRLSLEQAFPDSRAVFTNGAAGNINTGHSAQASITGQAAGRTYADAERIGLELGRAAVLAAKSAVERRGDAVECSGIPFASSNLLLPLRSPQTPEEYAAEAVRWDERAAELLERGEAGSAATARARGVWASRMAESPSLPLFAQGEMVAFRIGPAVFVTFPGEAFVEFGLAMRNCAPDWPVFVLGYTGGALGYVPTEEAIKVGGYEADDSFRFYGFPAPYTLGSYSIAQSNGERLVNEVTAM